MIAFTGPKIAMLLASGSFLAIAGTVMTISKVSPQALQKSNYKNIDIYGRMFYYWGRGSHIFLDKDWKDKTFTCELEGTYFACSMTKVNAVPKLSQEQTCYSDEEESQYSEISQKSSIYKITGPRDKMENWKTSKTVQIKIIDKDKQIQYSSIESFLSVDGKLHDCINPKFW